MMLHNEALLAKWWCRFNKENNSLWAEVILNKYKLGEFSMLSEPGAQGKISAIWNDISSVRSHTSTICPILQHGFRAKAQSGDLTNSWYRYG